MSPLPQDESGSFEVPFQDTVAYRIGSEVHRHSTRLELLEARLSHALEEHGILQRNIDQQHERFERHEAEQHTAQHKLMIVIILTLLSATGGLIVLTVQSLVTIAK
jgi:hypothetical protein